MNRPRVSVFGVLALVAYVGIALAALTTPTMLWSKATLSLTLALLVYAGLGALYGRGEARAFWGGFVLVGAGYLAVTFLPWIDEAIGPRLITTALVEDLYQQYQVREGWGRLVRQVQDGVGPIEYFELLDRRSYRVLCHSIICPVLSFLGGIAAARFTSRSRTTTVPATSVGQQGQEGAAAARG